VSVASFFFTKSKLVVEPVPRNTSDDIIVLIVSFVAVLYTGFLALAAVQVFLMTYRTVVRNIWAQFLFLFSGIV
jgi:hypothetical protein